MARYRAEGADGLEDRSSAPAARPTRIPLEMLELIDRWRRDHKWSARRIHHELTQLGHHCCLRTVSRWLKRLGIGRRRDLDPTARQPEHPGDSGLVSRIRAHASHVCGGESCRERPTRPPLSRPGTPIPSVGVSDRR